MKSTDDLGEAGLSLTAGGILRSAREAAGLSRSDIASRTKIAERHLLAIEENRFGDLAARTYAVGFARAYARALGLDEAEIAAIVRAQLDAEDTGRIALTPSFEPGDPARVPPVRLVWFAGGGAVVVVALLLMFWGSFLSPQGKLPDLLPTNAPKPVASTPSSGAPARSAPSSPSAAGLVVLTATEDHIWVSVTDAGGARLLEKELAKGESWTMPAGVQAPKLRTGRPDALRVTVGATAIPPLSQRPQTVSNISLAAPDLLARLRSAATTTPGAAPSAARANPAPFPAPTDAARPATAPAVPSKRAATGPSAIRPSAPMSESASADPAPAAAPASPRPSGAAEPLSTVSN